MAFGQQGESSSPGTGACTAKLPPELEESLGSRFPSVRLEAVEELGKIVHGRHEVRSHAARDALKRLTEDDSRRVAGAAIDILKALDRGVDPLPTIDPVPPPGGEVDAARFSSPRWLDRPRPWSP